MCPTIVPPDAEVPKNEQLQPVALHPYKTNWGMTRRGKDGRWRVVTYQRAAAASSASRASTQALSPSGKLLPLPERRLGLEPVDQEGGGIQRRLPVGGRGQHQHDVLARQPCGRRGG